MEVEIQKLDNKGRGICYVNDIITFVSNALPNEVVKIELVRENPKYNIGKVVEYIKTSPLRKKAFCPYYGICGGCDIEHLSYEDGINYKKEMFEEILFKYAGVQNKIEFIKSDPNTHYRNKITLKVNNGKVGFYEEESHDIVKIDNCYLAKESINKVIPYLKLENGSVIVRANYNDEIMIDITSEEEVNLDIPSLTKENKIVGIILNDELIYGEDHFMEKVGHKLFQVHNASFFQVNLDIAKKVVDIIKNEVNKNDVVLDAYCGVGFLGLSIAENVKIVYGIEVVRESVLDALLNMKINKINNAKFMLGKSERILDNVPKTINTVIVDPPREGVRKKVKDYLLNNKNIKKIIYMSCNPFTLGRDLMELKQEFTIEKIYAFDMFCYTKHVESVVILKRI